MIVLSKVPEEYQHQVWRFLTYYPITGQAIAKRYLDLVLSPEYNKGAARPYRKPDTISQPKIREFHEPVDSHWERALILREIQANPGQTAKQIAGAIAIPLGTVRRHLSQLKKEGTIEGFSLNRAGYFLKGDKA